MRLTTLIMFFFLLGFAQTTQAQTTVHGFALDKVNLSTNTKSLNTRLIITSKINNDFDAKVLITPTGPLPFWSYYELIWNKPVKGVDSIEIGRIFPSFGRGWNDYRADQVPTLNYSEIYNPLVGIDTGISASGHSNQFKWYAGAFVGDRLFGNVPQGKTSPDYYIRSEYKFNPTLTLGASQRFGIIPASGVDLLLIKGRSQLTLETVISQGISQEVIQAEYYLNKRVSFASNHEWLQYGNRTGITATVKFNKNYELKLLRQTNPNQTTIQTAFKF